MEKDDKYLTLEQYRIYSEAKERFIDRQFCTNRFYLVLNVIILVVTYVLSALFPNNDMAVIVLSLVGVAVTIFWWMNIDSYQLLIKIKYANVLEYLETKLPEQPYRKEFESYKEIKKNGKFIVFGDVQKALTLAIVCVYIVALLYAISNVIKYSILM